MMNLRQCLRGQTMPMSTNARLPFAPEPPRPPRGGAFLIRRLSLGLVALAVAVLPACNSSGDSAPLVKPGDTRDRVLAIMGPPVVRQYRGLDEAWQYKQTGTNYVHDQYLVIWLNAGMVTSVTTYTNDEDFRINSAIFTQVRWADAPALPKGLPPP